MEKVSLKVLGGVKVGVGLVLRTQNDKNVIVERLFVRSKGVKFAKTRGEDLVNYTCQGDGGEIGRLWLE